MKSFKQYIQEKTDKKDSITFDIPLLIRVLELAREDVKTDMELHRVVERLINIRDKGTLTMDDYNFIANLKEEYIDETGRCWDGYKPKAGKKAYAKGSCVKEDGMGAGAAGGVAGPTNVVGGGAIAGTGGKGGEPGVNLKKQNKSSPKSPVMGIINRKMPKI